MHKRTLAFPPLVLTHVTKDNMCYFGLCEPGVNAFFIRHHIDHLTAFDANNILNQPIPPIEQIWIRYVSGRSQSKTGWTHEYQDGHGEGFNQLEAKRYGYGLNKLEGDGESDEEYYGSTEPI